MLHHTTPLADPAADPLAALLAELEAALALVQQALSQRDALALEQHAGRVQQLMSLAIAQGKAQSQQGVLQPALRHRLAQAGAQMAAQRELLGRATAALDRAIDVLMPAPTIGLYGQAGKPLRQRSSGEGLTA